MVPRVTFTRPELAQVGPTHDQARGRHGDGVTRARTDIAELTARVRHRDRIDAVSTTIHAYPTMAEGPSRAADEYLRRKYARPLPAGAARLALALRRLSLPGRR